MTTIFTKGDLLENPTLHARALGCPCDGSLDAGIAVAFKKRWPALAEALRARCASSKLKLGEVFVWNDGGETVYCLAIQDTSAKKATLPALEQSLTAMVALAAEAGVKQVGVPRLGAGAAGLEWMRVKSILGKVGRATSVELLVFEQFVRASG